MELKAISRRLRFCAIACLAVFSLAASEHHGIVKFGSIAVPGATVTATKGDKKVVTVTDEAGMYTFPDLEDGVWKIQVEMLTFTPATKDIGVASGAPGAEWELKMMSMDELKPALQAAPRRPRHGQERCARGPPRALRRRAAAPPPQATTPHTATPPSHWEGQEGRGARRPAARIPARRRECIGRRRPAGAQLPPPRPVSRRRRVRPTLS